jgi:5-methylcytosine-specific restriction endonuclease McrA
MGVYTDSASKRKLSFDLSKDQFRHLTSSPCHYCGSRPTMIKMRHNDWTSYVFNGVDRVDNQKGYSLDNCVACCRTCNRGKGAWGYDYWVNYLKQLTDNAKSGGVPCLLLPIKPLTLQEKTDERKQVW